MTFAERPDDELRDFHDAVGMVAHELLFDRRTVVEGFEDNVAHRRQF
jgi:hypothetical protein